ncbi:uncharacterized protein [Dermacentor andersoni]|uniref:uncharacterized protein n=1 Tax=Dermacentor andersoni TaxID=34620 RepID=UPI003B3B1B46
MKIVAGGAKPPAQPKTTPATETSIVKSNNADGTAAGMTERNASSTATTTTTRGVRATTMTTTTTAMPYNSLVCTLNANTSLNSVSELPEDGLCDFSFYQAWEERHSMLQGPGGPYAATFELVLQAAAQHNKTEYGLSFDYE